MSTFPRRLRDLIATAAQARRGRGGDHQPTPRGPRPPAPGRRGCVIVGVLGVVTSIVLVMGASYWLGRAVSRIESRYWPTPTRTPDIAALGPGVVVGSPSIDVATIQRVLAQYHSPATADAQAIYDDGVQHNIDPAYCLAFFIHESAAGTQGVARTTYSIGNIRAKPGEPSYDGYRLYSSWREGIADWYRLIDDLYVHQWNLTTVDAIVPVYAPSTDNNDEATYIYTIKWLVAGWRGL
ncbi:MAG TPA: glucosaminidase domain-containing protein [Thermomicrobiales bacterium]|jgi:hypothetical protein|nr:glucosaminidase domain-containing protein [Thermomicrobiales bacterium]